ncbi:PREDICTED: signal peptide, CUB and EGF-like domain-containing protein 3 [Nicrophorus vespilloides]|uniref:Signal peptide, CUB and EGF-like domain-containing protein 3 n=1 Tax=Nicrophorus vespilloides TaxID=110193 RepID=A0ABM1MYZ1_NICVS|nr:PREDICTED: signal peptide, CUB and EGF-like domain-containing protein 3 [Nicrophorus vespilloides]
MRSVIVFLFITFIHIEITVLGQDVSERNAVDSDATRKTVDVSKHIPRHPQSHLLHLTNRLSKLNRRMQIDKFKSPDAKEKTIKKIRRIEGKMLRIRKLIAKRSSPNKDDSKKIRLKSKKERKRPVKKSKKSDKENVISNEIAIFKIKEADVPIFTAPDKRCRNCRQRCIDGKCACFDGFRLSTDGKRCYDIDECMVNNGGCSDICENKMGRYVCQCNPGYKLAADAKTCIDSNECLLNNGHGPCEDTCTNIHGSFRCSCRRPNTVLSSNGINCDVIDQCMNGRSGCSHLCIHSRRGPYCSCPDGLILGHDRKTCHDFDECSNEKVLRICPLCLNAYGSYVCLQKGISNVTCPALETPQKGFFDCSRERGMKSSIKWISDRVLRLNQPGTVCRLECPETKERKQIVCNGSGNWVPKRITC